MDKNEAYLSLTAKIATYERELAKCSQKYQECVRSSQLAENAIEQHFSILINTLAARKAALLGEIAHKVSNQKKNVEAAAGKLQKSIEASKKLMEAGTLTFGVNVASAELIWKSSATMPALQMPNLIVTTVLPDQLREAIQRHGSVGELVTLNNNVDNQQSGVTIHRAKVLENEPVFLEAKPVHDPFFQPRTSPIQPQTATSFPFISTQPPVQSRMQQPIISYDIHVQNIEGLTSQIQTRFPQACNYNASYLLPYAIITFLPNLASRHSYVAKLERICEERSMLGIKHFVIIVVGDALSVKFKCTAQYNVELDGFVIPHIKQSSINEAFKSIESQL